MLDREGHSGFVLRTVFVALALAGTMYLCSARKGRGSFRLSARRIFRRTQEQYSQGSNTEARIAHDSTALPSAPSEIAKAASCEKTASTPEEPPYCRVSF